MLCRYVHSDATVAPSFQSRWTILTHMYFHWHCASVPSQPGSPQTDSHHPTPCMCSISLDCMCCWTTTHLPSISREHLDACDCLSKWLLLVGAEPCGIIHLQHSLYGIGKRSIGKYYRLLAAVQDITERLPFNKQQGQCKHMMDYPPATSGLPTATSCKCVVARQ